MNPRIVTLSGSLKGTEFPVTEEGFVLGRKHPENDASLENDDMVSRRHCRFELRDGQAVLLDLESRNGTFVIGAAVIQRVLEHGDRVKVGSPTFIYMEQAETADGLPAFEDDDHERTCTILRIPVDRSERSDTVILRNRRDHT